MESEGSKIILSYFMHELKSSCFDEDSKSSIFQKISKSFELYYLNMLPYECCLHVFMNEGVPDYSLKILNRLKEIKTLTHQPTNPKARTSSHDSNKKKRNMWSEKEDNRLLAGIYLWGPTKWKDIASFVGNGRTVPQCSQRWRRGLNPTIRKDAWLPEEDQKLIGLVKEIGDKQWSKLSSLMGTRNDVQCRYRYNQLIRKKSIVEKDGINTLQDSFRPQRPYRMCTTNNKYSINYQESSSEDIHEENNNIIQHNRINNSNQNDDNMLNILDKLINVSEYQNINDSSKNYDNNYENTINVNNNSARYSISNLIINNRINNQ